MRRRTLMPVLLVLAIAVFGPAAASAATIRVQSTTDTVDAGLVDGLLRRAFADASPGDSLAYVGVGTGKALENARTGIADVVITHAPTLERQFVDDGFSYEAFGRAIFFSDYVLVGPTGDPAGVMAKAPHDAVAVLEAIAAAGAHDRAHFVSRGDNSGTEVQEQHLWGLTRGVPVEAAADGGEDAARKEPGVGGAVPSWYHRTGKGQALNLQETAVCNAGTYPGGGCYTLVDRGTWGRIHAQGLIDGLKVVSEHNAPAARGGEDLLVNPFHAYIVDPAAVPAGAHVDVAAARRFLDFLTSPAFQSAVASFPTAADPAFRPDALPRITVSTPALNAVAAGRRIPLGVNVEARLPGAGPAAGVPVQLQRSTDGGSSWSDVGPPRAADRVGHVVFRPRIDESTRFRVTTPRHRDLSPAGAALGAVRVT